MRVLVNAMDESEEGATLEQLRTLVEDTQNLQQSLAALNPSNYLKFQAANLAGVDAPRPTDEHWAHVLVGLYHQFSAIMCQDSLWKKGACRLAGF